MTLAGSSTSSVTFERFTDRARNVIALSESMARDLGHNYIGTEHVLLAQFSMPEGLAAQILIKSGLTLAAVRSAVVDELGRGSGAPENRLPFTPRTIEVFTGALAAAGFTTKPTKAAPAKRPTNRSAKKQ